MLFLRSLLILLAFVSPAFSQEGARDAARAKDATQALALYLDGIAKSGRRPDYSKPPAADLLRQVFNIEELATLPPPEVSDVAWLLDWSGAANQANMRMMLFGIKPGANLDPAVVRRNQVECEDQCAAAANFMIHFMAVVATTMDQFMAQLTPEQRTPVREAGRQKARTGAAEMIEGTVIWVSQGMKPGNARLLTAALRETDDVWAAYVTPDDRTRILSMVIALQKIVKDHEIGDNLSAFAAALTAVK